MIRIVTVQKQGDKNVINNANNINNNIAVIKNNYTVNVALIPKAIFQSIQIHVIQDYTKHSE